MIEYSKTRQDLIDKTNQAIAELVYQKSDLQKAYNYYNGKRDPEQYKYLEENYGIGSPTKVEFVPLIRKHIDALVGEFLGTPIIPKVSCKDKDTISKITREKELEIQLHTMTFLKERLHNKLLAFIQSGSGQALTDDTVGQELEKLQEEFNKSFISSFEIAAQNVIEYIMQSRTTDIYTKLKQLFIDILVSGYSFYRVGKSSKETNVIVEVLDPRNSFPDRNYESPYVKDSHRFVYRRYLTRTQILNRYGKNLTKKEIDEILDYWETNTLDSNTYFVRNAAHVGIPATDGILAGIEVTPGFPDGLNKRWYRDLIPVYEVEWIETDKNFVMHRQSTVRIGDELFIINDEDEDVIRSSDNPDVCSLSVNGVYFLNRSGEPYSLMKTCMSLQDKYDCLMYYRDVLIANSGTSGDWVDLSLLPTALGVSMPERLKKFIAYKKSGIAPIDTSQEGRLSGGQASPNTIFSGYDDTIKAQAVQAIQLAIDSIEQTASSITGVFRERLNGIEQRDAVTNIKQGAQNSFIITKQYYQQMDLIVAEILIDCLNTSKIVFKKGLTGTLILGDKQQRIFTALPEKFTVTDYDIHITTTTDTLKDLEMLKQTIPQMIQSQIIGPDLAIDAIISKSLPDLKYKFEMAIKKKEAENSQIQQLSQQLEQMKQQLDQAQKQIQEQEKQIKQFDQQKMQLEQEKIKMENQVAWFEAKTERDYKEAMAEIENKRTEIELLQLHDGNPYNDKIREV